MIRILAFLLISATTAQAAGDIGRFEGIERSLYPERVLSEEIEGSLIRQHRRGCDRGRVVLQTQGITAGRIGFNRAHNQFLAGHVARINRRV
ncbi:MAG: hypothetical protein AAF501_12825, partial [Pseudomonadota bacterium]